MHQKHSVIHTAARVFQPGNPTAAYVPLIEICDHRRVLIERHRGVITYGDIEIAVRVSYGSVIVHGSGLKLRLLSKEKIVVTGEIADVMLRRE